MIFQSRTNETFHNTIIINRNVIRSDRMAKTRPRNGHIILPVNTDLFESVEENAKEHGVTIGQYLDMLLQRHITPSEFFKGVK